MMRTTGCDGVVVGRGCLGRPWLFGDLVDALSGRPVSGPRPLGVAADVMVDHARSLVHHHGDERRRAAGVSQAHVVVPHGVPRRR